MSIAPSGSSAIVAAVDWLQQTLLGTVATTVAIIAVASIGFLALSGRVDLRRSATVIIGCFILFGAPSIAVGLQALSAGGADGAQLAVPPPPAPIFQPPQRQGGEAAPFDPYAGAAVPAP